MGDHRRFFVGPECIDGDTATLTGDTAKQIARVLRLKNGDTIRLLDGCGSEHEARITAITKDSVTAGIARTEQCRTEPGLRLTLAMCLPKADKLDLIVQKCCELGISELVVVNSARSVSRIPPERVDDKLARWHRIAIEAAEQSGRGCVPRIEGIIEFEDLAARMAGFALTILAWECAEGNTLRDVLRDNAGIDSAMLVIGPEGGLTEQEVEKAVSAGAKCVSLGRRILRCETAAVAACAVVMYEIDGEL